MKKIMSVVFLCLFLVSCGGGGTSGTLSAQQSIPLDQLGIQADRSSGIAGIIITSYTGAGGAIVISRDLHGVPIRSIGKGAFREKKIFNVTIPNGVTSIGESAFRNNLITSVTIPNSVTSIGDFAFSDNLITSVTIPNSVTSIGDFAFSNNLITSVTIPNSVTSIGGFAFRDNLITSVTFQRAITEFGRIGNNPHSGNFPFDGDLMVKFSTGGPGTYTRPNAESRVWAKR